MSAAKQSASEATAVAVVRALVAGGVTDVVLSPGSRSAGLAIALHQADVMGLLRLHVRIDERGAGFLALGLARGGHRPVAVVTTSGTAVANLHPALLEASHGGVPVVAVTADRPAALRGTGANQTTDQVSLFAPQVRTDDVADAAAAAAAIARAVAREGPSHVNVQFEEPLLPGAMPLDLSSVRAPTDDVRRQRQPPPEGSDLLVNGPRTVVIAGDDAGPPARILAERAGWPLLAEPTSGARTGANAIRTYRLLLGGPLADEIERVVVTGHPTLSRPVTRLISRADIEVVGVPGPGGVITDPGRVARRLRSMPAVSAADDPAWLDRWRAADAGVSRSLDELADSDHSAVPLRVARAVAAAVTPEALLVVGSSQPVRDLDLMARPYPPGERRLVLGNRGLAGIDGLVSTAIGAALARRSSRALAYLGDLAFLHDAGALVLGPDEPRPALTIVVANDDGGSIFATLEQGAAAFADGFERVFATPHGVDIASLCAASHTRYERADDVADLERLLAEDPVGIRVVEVRVPRLARRALDERTRRLVAPGAS